MLKGPSPYLGTTPAASLGHVDGAVTLVEGQTFCLSGRTGDMNPDMPHGLFVLDTRVLSCWQLRVNGFRLEPLTVDLPAPFSAVFVGRVHPRADRADSDVVVFRERDLGAGMRERWTVTNYGGEPVEIPLECTIEVDFADLFAVKEHRAVSRPAVVEADGSAMTFTEPTAQRVVRIEVEGDLGVYPGLLSGVLQLPPRGTWTACLTVTASVAGEELTPQFRCGDGESGDGEHGDGALALPSQRLASWRASLPRVSTDDERLAHAVRRAGEDLGALRIFDPDHPDVPIVAAGAPWFMTVFGRDSLLTAWMCLLAEPRLAEGVLETLARFQGTEVVPETEEEPGKILHEMRFGQAARPSLSSGEVYYGSIDATPLFVMLLGELRRWGLADDVVRRLLPHADRALAWIEEYGDRDGDGYVEYERKTEYGLANQGWKDSWDGIRCADGRFPPTPIALCEVQGYVYAAYLARAHFADEAGDVATAEHYRAKARDLYIRFNEDFWLEDRGWYALGLDGDKRPIDACASNMAHCLWTGIVAPERAAAVAERLLAPDMFSGWGIRTLSTEMAAFNPVSYHNGSVWPHDNAIAAAGLARYGFVDHAHEVIRAQLDVSEAFGGRLPELFAGFTRGRPATPAVYPTSCSPQAWAAAAPLLWLRTLLRLDPWASHGEVRIAPALPSWLERLRVEDVEIGGESLTVSVERGVVEVEGAGHLRVVDEPREPVSLH